MLHQCYPLGLPFRTAKDFIPCSLAGNRWRKTVVHAEDFGDVFRHIHGACGDLTGSGMAAPLAFQCRRIRKNWPTFNIFGAGSTQFFIERWTDLANIVASGHQFTAGWKQAMPQCGRVTCNQCFGYFSNDATVHWNHMARPLAAIGE